MRRMLTGLAASVLLAASAVAAMAQQGPGGLINPQRDCQTLTTCNFAKGGSFRGCLSSYSCRVCKLVAARCSIPGPGPKQKICREMRCTWGA